MSKVIVVVSNPDAGDEGSYNGSVIGMIDAILDSNHTKKVAIQYVVDALEGEVDVEDMEYQQPHPHDSNYESCVVVCGEEYFHFREI